MMEKQNRTIEKGAAGDSGALDDIVDFASRKMSRPGGPVTARDKRKSESQTDSGSLQKAKAQLI